MILEAQSTTPGGRAEGVLPLGVTYLTLDPQLGFLEGRPNEVYLNVMTPDKPSIIGKVYGAIKEVATRRMASFYSSNSEPGYSPEFSKSLAEGISAHLESFPINTSNNGT